MNTHLNGKVALITGAASGIGLGIAKEFHHCGAKVIITDLKEDSVKNAAKAVGENCVGIVADVTRSEDMESLYKRVATEWGALHIVVANAGLGVHRALGQIRESEYDRVFDTNVKGVIFTVQPALPLLRAHLGSVLIIGSIGSIKPPRAMGVYGGAKAAIRNFVRSWVQDLKGTGVRINVLSPGAIDTESLRKALSEAHGQENLESSIKSMGADTPLERIGKVEEVAKAAVFLTSDDSSYINGVELFIDGGLTCL